MSDSQSTGSTKFQSPTFREASRFKNHPACNDMGTWGLEFLWSLVLGIRRFLSQTQPMSKPDQLRELWRMQDALNQRIGVNTHGMTEAEKTKWILNYSRAMTQEIAELTDSVPWKWWAKYQKFDEQNARVEVVDLFHFLISMAQVLGMSADDVFAA
jgi:hypothetical protein